MKKPIQEELRREFRYVCPCCGLVESDFRTESHLTSLPRLTVIELIRCHECTMAQRELPEATVERKAECPAT